ncbi:MAG TPA: GNAT family N-acetyltransferase [Vicinamibacterales bacterium]|nr:GNAT family N-acetyltransferase [Vicinamibacterales bacterium]
MTTPRTAVRTYLDMPEPAALRPAAPPRQEGIRVERVVDCPASFWRYLYTEVGRQYHWVDRLSWTDDEIRAYVRDPGLSLWLLTVRGAPAGYFELRREEDGAVEIAYFGLLDEFIGRGLGGFLLTAAVERAWDLGASRVWLHTCSLDHPAAISNYLSRGFRVTGTEEYEVPQTAVPPQGQRT